MISMSELNPHNYPTDGEIGTNLAKLLNILNQIRIVYSKPITIDSGLRSQADQMRINPKAPMSKHLTGQAADIRDEHGDFWSWCMLNMDLMEKLGVYFEDKNSTPTWTHIQIVAPCSGKRIFKP